MNAKIVQFLRGAALGDLRIGLSASEVTRALGSSLARCQVGPTSEIVKYGPLEITIDDGKVGRLKLSCLESAVLPGPLQEIAVPPAETTLYEFLEDLEKHQIGWEIDATYTFGRQLCIQTEAGARAYFDLDNRELQSIQV